MKNAILFFMLIISLGLNGQPDQCGNPDCLRTDSVNITTGLANDGSIITPAIGAVDPNWRLINNPPLIACTSPYEGTINGSAYVVNLRDRFNNPIGPGGWVNQVNASALAPVDLGDIRRFGCDNAENEDGETVPYIFVREFGLCQSGRISLDFTFKGDDQIFFDLYDATNDVVIGGCGSVYIFATSPLPPAGICKDTFDLAAGKYQIRGHLTNTDAVTLGFSVAGSIEEINGNEVLIQGPICCPNTTLNIVKVLENNCDGVIDVTDNLVQGWTFNVLDNTNTLVATGTTDVNGNLFVNGLAAGTYTVQEQVQAGFYPNVPASGSQQIQITEGFNQVTFLNCEGENPNAAIPTMTQWGIFLTILLILNLTLLTIYNVQLLPGRKLSEAPKGLSIPFDKIFFNRSIPFALGLTLAGMLVIIVVWGEILPQDIFGLGLSFLLFAYMRYLVSLVNQKSKVIS